MNTRAPSPLACLFLLPCAYVCEGSFRNVRKTLARGWPYFYELLADRHRIGKACADLPHWEAVTILSFFFGASYLQRHGGALLRPCQRGCQASEIRLEGYAVRLSG